MTAKILLIRHAAHSHLDNVLSGRAPGIALSSAGRSQAKLLAHHLEGLAIDRIHSSPIQRAQETAQAIAARHCGVAVETVPALEELDFGEWAGRTFLELADDPRWSNWNDVRESAIVPNGESMAQAQQRAWDHIAKTALNSPGRTIAMISHCDIIRAIVAHVLGLSLNHIQRFEIDPASVTRLAVGSWGAKVLVLNEICHE